ncbi:ROK family protein [Mangrovihabitans endophyticus]|uniref:Uncharacterized protein n=1 Tax=Mangrovihabitans endophyticus TaxID=1751298 RepID=A0A8J3FN59_9ACTN|nr:ROK family protein [Mangrovihabitans endophyticus]GGK78806.1 hypothetical protein GCM10012284_10900 [Mangrovihabitans endophyticus]
MSVNVVGVEISATVVIAACSDLTATAVTKARRPVSGPLDPVTAVCAAVRAAAEAHPRTLPLGQIVMNAADTTAEVSSALGPTVRRMLAREWNVPVVVVSDARLAARAETPYMRADGHETFTLLYLADPIRTVDVLQGRVFPSFDAHLGAARADAGAGGRTVPRPASGADIEPEARDAGGNASGSTPAAGDLTPGSLLRLTERIVASLRTDYARFGLPATVLAGGTADAGGHALAGLVQSELARQMPGPPTVRASRAGTARLLDGALQVAREHAIHRVFEAITRNYNPA